VETDWNMSSGGWRPAALGLLAALLIACAAPATPPPAAPVAGSPAAVAPERLAAAPAAAPTAAPAPASIKVVYTALSGSTWPLWIAQDAGFLEQNAIGADLQYVVSSTTAMQSLLGAERNPGRAGRGRRADRRRDQ
jgi:hypothetical protein